MQKLNNKDKILVDEYLLHLDAGQAALTAGYSKTVARTKAYVWVSNSKHNPKPHVFKAVQAALKKRSQRTEISQDRVLEEYAKLAFLDPRLFYNDNDELLPVNKLPKEVAAALAGFEVVRTSSGDDDPTYTSKIKFVDKKGALDSLAKHLGMFSEGSSKPEVPTSVNITFSDA